MCVTIMCSEEEDKSTAREPNTTSQKERITFDSEFGFVIDHETNLSCDHDELVLQACMDVASKNE